MAIEKAKSTCNRAKNKRKRSPLSHIQNNIDNDMNNTSMIENPISSFSTSDPSPPLKHVRPDSSTANTASSQSSSYSSTDRTSLLLRATSNSSLHSSSLSQPSSYSSSYQTLSYSSSCNQTSSLPRPSSNSSALRFSCDQPSRSHSTIGPISPEIAQSIPPDNNINLPEKNAVRQESTVWKYAKRNVESQTATCNDCNAIIKTTNGSTTGLRKHLMQKHKIQFAPTVPVSDKPKIAPSLKKELHQLIVKSIVQDGRSFSDFRRQGMMKFLNRIVPGNYLISNNKKSDSF